MKHLPNVRLLVRFVINPGWAPISVVAVFLILASTGLTEEYDHLLHSLGGASIAYFLHILIELLPTYSTAVPKWFHFLLSFTSACTVALFWEFAEFAADRFIGTSMQMSVDETIFDLLSGVIGAIAVLILIAVNSRRN